MYLREGITGRVIYQSPIEYSLRVEYMISEIKILIIKIIIAVVYRLQTRHNITLKAL